MLFSDQILTSIKLPADQLETALPPACMCCGQAAEHEYVKSLSIRPPDLGPTPVAGARLAVRAFKDFSNAPKINLRCTLCTEHQNYWRDRLILLLGGMIGFFALAIVGGILVALLVTVGKVKSRWPEALLFLTPVVYLAVWIYASHRVLSKSIRARGDLEGEIEIQNVSEGYAEQFEEYRNRPTPTEGEPGTSEKIKPSRFARSSTDRLLDIGEPDEGRTSPKLEVKPWMIAAAAGVGLLGLIMLVVIISLLSSSNSSSEHNSISTAPPRTVPIESVDDPSEIRSKTYLSDLSEDSSKVGFGKFGKNGQLGYGIGGAVESPVKVNGKKFPKALSTFPPNFGDATVQYTLDKKYREFYAWVTINDLSDTKRTGPDGLLSFKVLGDGRELWTSLPLGQAGSIQVCKVNVFLVEKLELVVSCPSTSDFARAVWLQPYLIK